MSASFHANTSAASASGSGRPSSTAPYRALNFAWSLVIAPNRALLHLIARSAPSSAAHPALIYCTSLRLIALIALHARSIAPRCGLLRSSPPIARSSGPRSLIAPRDARASLACRAAGLPSYCAAPQAPRPLLLLHRIATCATLCAVLRGPSSAAATSLAPPHRDWCYLVRRIARPLKRRDPVPLCPASQRAPTRQACVQRVMLGRRRAACRLDVALLRVMAVCLCIFFLEGEGRVPAWMSRCYA